MFVIRDAQRAVMRDAVVRTRLLRHVAESFPEDQAVLGEARMRLATDVAIERGEAHGFLDEPELRRWVALTFVLGASFDEDPLFPWARRILTNPLLTSPRFRMHSLQAAATDYLDRTAGPDGDNYRAALVRARRATFQDVTRERGDDDGAVLRALLFWLYPEQYRALSERTLAALLALGGATAQAYGLGSRRGHLVYLMMMYLLGSHFDRDAMHPWAATALALRLDPDAKAERLHAAAMGRLDRYAFAAMRGAASGAAS